MRTLPRFPVAVMATVVVFMLCANMAIAETGPVDSVRVSGAEVADSSKRPLDASMSSDTDIGANLNPAARPLDKAEIEAIAQLVFDKLAEQKPSAFAKPEMKITDNQVLDVLTAQNDNMVAFGTLITCLILLSGILTGFIQYKERKELERFEDRIREDSEQFRDEMRGDFEQKKILDNLRKELDDRTAKIVEDLFEERYSKQLAQYTRAIAEETLMMTPEARGALLGQLRGTIGKIAEITGKLPSEDATEELYKALIQAAQNWHTLGQLYSVDTEQLKQGLGAFRANPVPGARERLKLLRTRYRDDMEIHPLVAEAIAALERQESVAGH